jgi:hypothetical protein
MGSVAKSYEEGLPNIKGTAQIYEEVLSQYMTLQPLNFLIFEENFISFFIMNKNIDGIYCLLPNLSYSLIFRGAFISVQCITNFT